MDVGERDEDGKGLEESDTEVAAVGAKPLEISLLEQDEVLSDTGMSSGSHSQNSSGINAEESDLEKANTQLGKEYSLEIASMDEELGQNSQLDLNNDFSNGIGVFTSIVSDEVPLESGKSNIEESLEVEEESDMVRTSAQLEDDGDETVTLQNQLLSKYDGYSMAQMLDVFQKEIVDGIPIMPSGMTDMVMYERVHGSVFLIQDNSFKLSANLTVDVRQRIGIFSEEIMEEEVANIVQRNSRALSDNYSLYVSYVVNDEVCYQMSMRGVLSGFVAEFMCALVSRGSTWDEARRIADIYSTEGLKRFSMYWGKN
jgi:hypothetical protein